MIDCSIQLSTVAEFIKMSSAIYLAKFYQIGKKKSANLNNLTHAFVVIFTYILFNDIPMHLSRIIENVTIREQLPCVIRVGGHGGHEPRN